MPVTPVKLIDGVSVAFVTVKTYSAEFGDVCPDTPAAVAVMVALPAPTMVTAPVVPFTVATFSLPLE